MLFDQAGNETSPYQFYYSPHFSNDLGLELGSPTTQFAVPARGTPVVGAWTYLVVTFDGLDITFYENTDIVYGPVGFSSGTSLDGGTVASFTIGSDSAGNNDFNGEIDEFAIYDTALDNATIVQHFLAAGPTRPAGCRHRRRGIGRAERDGREQQSDAGDASRDH